MQTNKILTSELIDIIFDGRNKEYGAYELRKNYSKRVRDSLLVTGIIASVAIGGSVLANSMKKNDSSYRIVPGIELTQIPDEKEPEPLPEPEREQPEPEQVRTEKFTTLEILPDEEVQSPPPDQETLEKAAIDVEQQKAESMMMAIVADENGFYHASSSKGITYSPFAGYWEKRIVGFRRVPVN